MSLTASPRSAITPASCTWRETEPLVLPEAELDPLLEPLLLPEVEPDALPEVEPLVEPLPLPAPPDAPTPASMTARWSWVVSRLAWMSLSWINSATIWA